MILTGEESRFYTLNFVDSDTDIAASEGQTSVRNMFDYRLNTFWSADTPTGGAVHTITFQFFSAGQPVQKTFQSMLMLNHNLKAFEFYYYDYVTNNWQAPLEWQRANSTGDDLIVSQGVYASDKFRLWIYDTIIPGAIPFIAELFIFQLLGYIPTYSDFNFADDLGKGFQRTVDGTGEAWHVWAKKKFSLGWENLDQSEYVVLKNLYESFNAFMYWSEPFDHLGNPLKFRDIFRVKWNSEWNAKYSSKYKGGGYSLTAELNEI